MVVVDRLERDLNKIKALYNLGLKDAKENYERLLNWMNR
ncbi:DUF6363 domain-containing protein [Cetobacterium sp.]